MMVRMVSFAWSLIFMHYHVLSTVADTCVTSYSTEVNGTCCPWYCNGQDSSQDCSACGGMGGNACVRIDNQFCRAGDWQNAAEGEWFPSRSTHFGFTSAGACGFGVSPNCYEGQTQFDCSVVPEDLTASVMAGMYAAPQGNYYTQVGDYLSCGECFEIACRDKACVANSSITVQLVDSCPCEPNTRWCCGSESHCGELQPADDGPSHCAITGGPWGSNSIHLDLSDPAFCMLTTGDKTKYGPAGIINTIARRVACPVVGNMFIRLSSGVVSSSCNAGSSKLPCFYYFSFSVLNAAKLGGVTEVSMYASLLQNNKLSPQWMPIPRNHEYPPASVQEQYGAFTAPSTLLPLFPPFAFAFTAADGTKVATKVFSSVADCNNDIWTLVCSSDLPPPPPTATLLYCLDLITGTPLVNL